MPSPEDQDLFDDTGDGGSSDAGDGDNAAAAADGAGQTGGQSDSKGHDALMSKWQAAEARAKKAEAALAAASKKAAGPGDGAGQAPAGLPPEMTAAIEELREGTRRGVYASNPIFAKHQIDPALITGSTHAEMTASAAQLSTMLEAIESRAANEALASHGLVPAATGGVAAKKLGDIASMSREEFEKLVEAGKQGAFLPR